MFEKALAFVLALSMAVGSGGAAQIREGTEKLLSVPIIDGAKETAELTAAFVSGYTGINYNAVLGDTAHSGTDVAFERLYSGEVDIVIDTYLQPHMTDGFIENYFEYSFETVAIRTVDVIDPPYEYTDHEYYRVFYDKNRINQNVIDFIEFTLSDKGQASVYQSNFEPIREIALPYFEKPPYETLGTGEPRPEDFEKSKEFSALSFAYSNYGTSEEYAHNIDIFLLENDLTNTKLEKEINNWIEETIKNKILTDKYRDCIVYFQAINGYLEVVISRTPGEGGYYLPDSPVSVWNLKTGKRVTEFSDLFYEGTDFLPALKETYKTFFPDKLGVSLTTEPDRFFITDFLLGDSDYRYIDDEYGGETVEDEYKLPINFLSSVMDYSPVWTYYDMTPFFTQKHLDPNEWRHVSDYQLPEFSKKAVMYNDNFREWEIISSRFLSEEEIEIRNSELKKLYNFIEQSEEYKNYKPEYEWQYPLNSTVEFSESGEIAAIYTHFGDFIRKRKTGEMKGPGDDIRLSGDEKFIGKVDYDFDGKTEWISINKGIRIYDENLKFIAEIQSGHKNDYINIKMWEVGKREDSENITGRISYEKSYEYGVILYEIVDGKIRVTSETLNEQNENTVTKPEQPIDRCTICYTTSALDISIADMFSQDYGKNQNIFQTQIKRAEDLTSNPQDIIGLYLAIDFGDGQNAVFLEHILFYNGKEITTERYGVHNIEIARVGDIVLIVTDSSGRSLNLNVMQYADGKLTESPISYLPTDISIHNNKIDITTHITDEFTVGGGLSSNTALGTFKNYFFFVSGSQIYEYGGIDYPIEEFRKISGGEKIIAEIEKDGGVITNILYRENNIININYDKVYDDEPDYIYHFNRTYKLNSSYFDNKLRFSLEEIELDNRGIYLPSYSEYCGEDIATYPARLPDIE